MKFQKTIIQSWLMSVSQQQNGRRLHQPRAALFLFFPALFFYGGASYGKVYVDIGSAKAKKSVTAIAPIQTDGEGGGARAAADALGPNGAARLLQTLKDNLRFSGYFQILSPAAFIDDLSQTAPVPHSKDPKGFRWENQRLSGADLLLFTSFSYAKETLRLKAALYDIRLRKARLKKSYAGKRREAERLINRLSNDIVRRQSGRKGVFLTKTAAVCAAKGSKKELFVMNWNGKNKRRLTYHRSLVMSPVWSPKGDSLAYTAFVVSKKRKGRQAALFLMDLKTKVARLLSSRSIAARSSASLGASFFPDGQKMLVTMSRGLGFMNIFRFSVKTGRTVPLTNGPRGAVNVEPSLHPKTGRIAFSSDRTEDGFSARPGRPMIYIMNGDGTDIKRLTFAGRNNAGPDWSPADRRLVFSGLDRGRFDIFIVNEDGTGLQRLTSSRRKNGGHANFESPSFSPDGRFIALSSDLTGVKQIYVMRMDDLSLRQITFHPRGCQSPRWSPYLP